MYQPVALAENLCRRLSDVELYTFEIQELASTPDANNPVLISSRLVGYFGSCKAVLDAGAIALTHLYGLGAKTKKDEKPFTLKEQDFAKGFFWQVLQSEQRPVYDRYQPLRGTLDEITLWRDAAIHRVSPLVITTMARDPSTEIAAFYSYSLVLDPEARLDALLSMEESFGTVSVAAFFNGWQPDISRFCEEVCSDIIANT